MKKLEVVVKEIDKITAEQAMEKSTIFFEEVTSNLYLVVKHRVVSQQGKYVTADYVAKELNTGFNVGLRRLNYTTMVNFLTHDHEEAAEASIYKDVL